MSAERHFGDGRVVAVRMRRGVPRADGRRAGERDRQVHFAALPAGEQTSPVVLTLCGDLLDLESADLLDGVAGMPCVRCFACFPHATAAAASPSRDRRRSA